MRLETLKSLTEDELSMVLFILNTEPPLPIKEVGVNLIPFYRDDALTFKISKWNDKVSEKGRPIFDSLMSKIANPKI